MWDTPSGVRTLTGVEALPVRDAIGWMVDMIHEEASGYADSSYSNVALFDGLTWTQRLAVLDEVSAALLLPSSEVANCSAVHEATVGAIFSTMGILIEGEICNGTGLGIRRAVRDAYRGCFDPCTDDSEVLPAKLGDVRLDRWEYVIEMLACRVLHDRDYALADRVLDLEPEKAELFRQLMGIDDSYYADSGEEVSEAQAAVTIQRIRELASSDS